MEGLECFLCHQVFNSKIWNLKRHMKSRHTKDAKYRCRICKQLFQNKTNAIIHYRRKHHNKNCE